MITRKAAARRPDANLRRLMSNLRRDQEAMEELRRLGIDASTVEAFQLGMREPYQRSDGRCVDRVLSFPVAADRGRRRFASINLPGVTVNPEHPSNWSAGAAVAVTWSVGSDIVVICGSPVEMWQLGQAAGRRDIAATFVTSSQAEVAPAVWSMARYWAKWERVLVTGSVPPAMRSMIAGWSGRPVEHAPLAACSPSNDVPIALRHVDWLLEILSGATHLGSDRARIADGDSAAGDFSAATTCLHGGWRDGRMYYPALVERRTVADRDVGPVAGLLHAYQTVVVRSDGAVLEGEILPAPPGTAAARRVHALTDGTRIDAAPSASRHATWSLGSIQAFVAARTLGRDPCVRPTPAVMRDAHAALMSRVWLPDADDHWLATGFAVLTHLARLFDAVPLLVAEGPRGSGKSELALAVAGLSFNQAVMGQGSAAALVRLAREGGGLVVLDDAEGLGPDTSGFSELAQTLKLGYKQSTARKPIVTCGGKVQTLDFFGPRLVTTTRGIEPVLASRCVTVRCVPSGAARPACDVDTDAVRDELHVIAMTHAAEVETRYRQLMIGRIDREGEIWAPLHAIAEVLGPPAMASALMRRRAAVARPTLATASA